MNPPIYIFDLDGTLALIGHRRHHVEGPKKNWPAFFAACIDDRPSDPVIETLQALRKSGAEIWIWSGRSDEVRADTEAWLFKHGCLRQLPFMGLPVAFKMRKAGDHQDDVALKLSWLKEVDDEDRRRIAAVFDDRDRVVRMWRENGLTCFQVAEGNF